VAAMLTHERDNSSDSNLVKICHMQKKW
jgi:hypothetical protein